jgi:hypothetical protein
LDQNTLWEHLWKNNISLRNLEQAIDGMWQLACQMHKQVHCFPTGGPLQANLSDDCIAMLRRAQVDGVLNSGHQLHKHSVIWKQVATFKAT